MLFNYSCLIIQTCLHVFTVIILVSMFALLYLIRPFNSIQSIKYKQFIRNFQIFFICCIYMSPFCCHYNTHINSSCADCLPVTPMCGRPIGRRPVDMLQNMKYRLIYNTDFFKGYFFNYITVYFIKFDTRHSYCLHWPVAPVSGQFNRLNRLTAGCDDCTGLVGERISHGARCCDFE